MYRWLLLGLAASGCNLYLGDDGDDDPPPPPIDGGSGPGSCGAGPLDEPPAAPGTIRYASRLATSANEFAWDVARTSSGSYFVVGELEGGAQGLIACFRADGSHAWTEFDSSVLRWSGVMVDSVGTPIVYGELRNGGGVVRRLQLLPEAAPPWSINFVQPSGSGKVTGIVSGVGGLDVFVSAEFTGTLDLNGQPFASLGGTDGLVLRIERELGQIVTAMSFGGTGDDGATGIALQGNNIAVAGHASSPSVQVGGLTLTGNGGDDVLAFRMDTVNFLHWARLVGGPGDERAEHVAVDEAGLVYVLTRDAILSLDELGFDRWTTTLEALPVHNLWDVVAGGGKVYTTGMYFTPARLGGVALPEPNDAPRFVAELDAATGAPGWVIAGEGPTIDAALELGARSLLVAGTYLVNFDMGSAHLDPSTPHDIYAMEIAR